MFEMIFANDTASWTLVIIVVLAALIMVVRPFLPAKPKNAFLQLLGTGFVPPRKSPRDRGHGSPGGSYGSDFGDFGSGDGGGGGE